MYVALLKALSCLPPTGISKIPRLLTVEQFSLTMQDPDQVKDGFYIMFKT